jgi:hypothetical protein
LNEKFSGTAIDEMPDAVPPGYIISWKILANIRFYATGYLQDSEMISGRKCCPLYNIFTGSARKYRSSENNPQCRHSGRFLAGIYLKRGYFSQI